MSFSAGKWLLFASILVLGFIVRVYHINTIPTGFFCDEASIAYNAYTIFHVGTDEFGTRFPVFFESFGDYKHPIAIYSTIPFIYLFGLTEFSVRFQSVVYGIILLVLIFLLTKELFASYSRAMWATCIAATMPWLMHYNRVGFELNSYVTFFTATIYLFVKAAKDKTYIIPAFLYAGVTIYTYQPAKLLVPVLVVLLGGYLYRKSFTAHKKQLLIGLLILSFLCIPLALSLLSGSGTARFNMVSVFSHNLTLEQIMDLMTYNYFTQLTTLFTQGEQTSILRHFSHGLLPLLLFTLPFAVLGVLSLLTTLRQQSSKLLLIWLLIYPLAGAVVALPPFTSRSIIGAPLFAILTAIGITIAIKFLSRFLFKPFVYVAIILMILFDFSSFLKFYFTSYTVEASGYWGWQYGPKEIIRYFEEHKNEYDDLVMIEAFNGSNIFFKFYAPGGCEKCKIGYPKHYYNPNRRQLFAIPASWLRSDSEFDYRPVKTIYYPDGKEAFVLVEIVNYYK